MKTSPYRGQEVHWSAEIVSCREKRKLLRQRGIEAEVIKSIVFVWDTEKYAVICGLPGIKVDSREIRAELSIPSREAGTIRLAKRREVIDLGYEIGAVGPWGNVPVYISRVLYQKLSKDPSRKVDLALSLDRSLLLSGSDFLQQAEQSGVLFPGTEEDVVHLDIHHRKGHESSFCGSQVEYRGQPMFIFDPRKDGVCVARQERYGPRYLLPLSHSKLEHHLRS